jgi:hypothetical protein
MLVNGKFYREEPPKIGANWRPKYKDDTITPEEQLVQDALLGVRSPEFSVFARVFGKILKI